MTVVLDLVAVVLAGVLTVGAWVLIEVLLTTGGTES